MVDATRPAGQQHELPLVHVVRTGGTWTDGRSASVELEAVDGQRFKLEVPADLLIILRNVMSTLSREARTMVARAQDKVYPHLPHSFTIAESPLMRGAVLLIFDGGMPTENAIAVPDGKALEFAAAIEANIVARMTPQQKLEHAKRRNGGGGLIAPSRKIIVP